MRRNHPRQGEGLREKEQLGSACYREDLVCLSSSQTNETEEDGGLTWGQSGRASWAVVKTMDFLLYIRWFKKKISKKLEAFL